MTSEPKLDPATRAESLDDLLLRREQVQDWLARLDEYSGDVPSHVAERVRSDYEARLRETVEALSEHLSGLQVELERLRTELHASGSRYELAVDRLEEARLRHRIGETEAAEWEARRAELEDAVNTAGAEREEVSSELQRMEQLVEQLQRSGAAAPAEDWLPVLSDPEPRAAGPSPAPEAVAPVELAVVEEDTAAADADQDLAFLEELDRALTTSGDDEAGMAAGNTDAGMRPAAGVRCPECGYTNDSTAWYCGVCGVDLA
jgi:regulator of replication initiation timing